MSDNVLKVSSLKVVFPTEQGLIRAVEGVDIAINSGECVAIVGESGCGKSVTSLAMMKLLSTPPALIDAKEHIFNGKDIKDLTDKQMQNQRGSDMSMVFQDALSALNPVMTVGNQIDEVFIKHKGLSKKEARKASIETLRKVGVPSPELRYKDYPHQLSGGMRQRALIAMAFACEPTLMIADEPTTALDVTIQAQVLDLLKELQKANNMALLLITHDLAIVKHMADRVYVMYSGKVMEEATTSEVFNDPKHPYTQKLLQSIPSIKKKVKRFTQITGNVPHPLHKPSGCYFHPRCEFASEKCREKMPPLFERCNRKVRCYLVDEDK